MSSCAASAGGAAATNGGARRALLFVCRHAEREDYVWKERGANWQSQAARPWDTPLTSTGHLQARALGEALASRWSEALGAAPISRILVSPLLRCVETGAAVAEVLGVPSVEVQPRLAETMCEEWYRSWGTPGADATWGGPDMGKPVADSDLHVMARGPSSACHATAAELEALRMKHSLSDVGRGVRAVAGERAPPDFRYCWGDFESHEQVGERLGAVASEEVGQAAGSVLLVSHGGPTMTLHQVLTKAEPPICGYCGLFAYERPAAGQEWQCLVAGNHDHLNGVQGTWGGPNDTAEQRPADA